MALVAMILGHLLTNGHLGALVVSVVILAPSLLLEPSLLVRVQQWMREPPQQEVSNHGCDEGAVKKIRALCPDLVSHNGSDGGVDLWISLTKQMQQLQQLR